MFYPVIWGSGREAGSLAPLVGVERGSSGLWHQTVTATTERREGRGWILTV